MTMKVTHRRRIRSGSRASTTQIRTAKSELLRAVEAQAREIKASYEDVVSDWSDENRPKFTIERERKVTDSEIRLTVRPYKRRKASLIFKFVDQGTKPHKIRAKPSNPTGRLAFRTSYSPKTTPIAQAHVGDGRSSGPWRTPQEVNHPGNDAREFSQTIERFTRQDYRRSIENTFRRLARRLNTAR